MAMMKLGSADEVSTLGSGNFPGDSTVPSLNKGFRNSDFDNSTGLGRTTEDSHLGARLASFAAAGSRDELEMETEEFTIGFANADPPQKVRGLETSGEGGKSASCEREAPPLDLCRVTRS
jgi:hypothetical protein